MSNRTITLHTGVAERPRRLAEHLYIVFDSDRPRGDVARYCLEETRRVEIGRAAAHAATRADGELRVGRNDGAMSSRHAELRFERGGWTIADLGSKNGIWVDGRQVESAPLAPDTIV